MERVKNINKYIEKLCVTLVIYQESLHDARSTTHKTCIHICAFFVCYIVSHAIFAMFLCATFFSLTNFYNIPILTICTIWFGFRSHTFACILRSNFRLYGLLFYTSNFQNGVCIGEMLSVIPLGI